MKRLIILLSLFLSACSSIEFSANHIYAVDTIRFHSMDNKQQSEVAVVGKSSITRRFYLTSGVYHRSDPRVIDDIRGLFIEGIGFGIAYRIYQHD